MLAATAIDRVLRRVRDPNALYHSRALVMEVLDYAQAVINAQTGKIKESASITNDPHTLVYLLDQIAPNAIHMLSARDNRSPLDKLSIGTLNGIDGNWFRRVGGDKHLAWTMLGKTTLIVYPAKDSTTGFDITYIKRTTELTSEDTALEMPDDMLDAVMDLTEAVLLLRQRLFDALKASVERFVRSA